MPKMAMFGFMATGTFYRVERWNLLDGIGNGMRDEMGYGMRCGTGQDDQEDGGQEGISVW